MFFNLQKYLLRRIKYQDQVVLTNRDIYMLPTKEGLFFSLILLLMLLTAINFSNSLIFLLTFFLASISIISMLYTQKNLLALSFQTATANPVFCNQIQSIPFIVSTSLQHKTLPATLKISCDNFSQSIDLLNQTEAVILAVKTTRRGYIKLPPITISSTFPFALFYAWSIIKLTNKSLVYPQMIKTKLSSQLVFVNTENGENDQLMGREDFAGLDKFVNGQSLTKVHWKAYAKQQGMYIKNYSGGSPSNKYWFDFDLFDASIGLEKRISYLSYLIVQAEKNGQSYGLKMPQQKIAINSGETHKQQCLKLLALFGNDSSTEFPHSNSKPSSRPNSRFWRGGL